MYHILITGCSSGIGLYCAKALHVKSEFCVYASARKDEDVQKLRQMGLWACKLDLDDNNSIQDGLNEVLKKVEAGLIFYLTMAPSDSLAQLKI